METFYAGMAEIRDIGGASEQLILQPHPDFRITDAGGPNEVVSYLHRDHLASIRLVTDSMAHATASAASGAICALGGEAPPKGPYR